MLIELVKTARGKNGVKTHEQPMLALCDEVWAVMPDEELGEFKLIHRPTGYAAVTGRPWKYVLAILLEIRDRDIDWAWTDPSVASALKDVWREIQLAADARLHSESLALALPEPREA